MATLTSMSTPPALPPVPHGTPRRTRRPRALGPLAAGLAAAAALAACSSEPDPQATTTTETATTTAAAVTAPARDAFPVTIEHAFGSTTIDAEPQRIVALGDGSQDVVAALGLVPVGIPTGYGGIDDDGVLPWYADHFDPSVTTLLPVFDGMPFELIASLEPDVILTPYAGFDANEYGLLSAIAPTVAYPDEPWVTPWQTQTRMIGQALGRADAAEALIADVEATLQRIAGEHPEFDGLTFTYLYTDATQAWAFLPTDSRVQLVEALGLVPAPGVVQLAKANPGGISAELSHERLTDVDADVVIVEQSDGVGDWTRVPLLDQLTAATSGTVIDYGTDDAAFNTALIPTVLSIPWAANRLATDLATAIAN